MSEDKKTVNAKRIDTVMMRVSEIGTGFGNPRKINKKKKEELRESLETYGDFGIFVIDENNDVIAGNQRLTILKEINPDIEVTCKKLLGYSEAEKRAINIKDNTHAGEWDLELLADWTADLNLNLGMDLDNQDLNDKQIKDMELIRYEKYNYVLIACKNEIDYNDLTRKLGIDGRKVAITQKRKIKARAIWYDQMKAQIIEKREMEESEDEKVPDSGGTS